MYTVSVHIMNIPKTAYRLLIEEFKTIAKRKSIHRFRERHITVHNNVAATRINEDFSVFASFFHFSKGLSYYKEVASGKMIGLFLPQTVIFSLQRLKVLSHMVWQHQMKVLPCISKMAVSPFLCLLSSLWQWICFAWYIHFSPAKQTAATRAHRHINIK